jgi:hypothetical protein
MTHLSRPYQVALAAIGVLAAVWAIALRGHSSSSSTSTSVPAPQPAAPKSAAPSSPYHGSAPGVAGLTRAIEKARGAVSLSEANAKQLQEQSAKASSPSSSATTGGSASSPSKSSAQPSTPSSPPATHTGSAAPARALPSTHTRSSSTRSRAPSAGARAAAPGVRPGSAPAAQQRVEAQLKQGKVVAILFWNPRAVVDQVVQRELQAVSHAPRAGLAVIDAGASQVGAFGAFTRAVQVLDTPTILFVNRHGQTRTLSGLTDAYALEQALGEAKQ